MIAALFGLILAMVVNIFLNSGLMDYIISIVMVLVFAGFDCLGIIKKFVMFTKSQMDR